jgi:hypothetical protein
MYFLIRGNRYRCARNGPIDYGGERGTRTLDLGIMSADLGR